MTKRVFEQIKEGMEEAIAKAPAIIHLQHLSETRDTLSEMESALSRMSMDEPDEHLSQALEMARLELHTVAERYNREVTRKSFLLSLDLEE